MAATKRVKPLDATVAACYQLRDARHAEHVALVAKEQSMRAMYLAGIPKSRIGVLVRDRLLAEDWTDADIGLVGVSPATVQAVLKTAR